MNDGDDLNDENGMNEGGDEVGGCQRPPRLPGPIPSRTAERRYNQAMQGFAGENEVDSKPEKEVHEGVLQYFIGRTSMKQK